MRSDSGRFCLLGERSWARPCGTPSMRPPCPLPARRQTPVLSPSSRERPWNIAGLTESMRCEEWLLFSYRKLTFLGLRFQVSHFICLFSTCSQAPPWGRAGNSFLPSRNTQLRKGRTGLLALPYAEQKDVENRLQTFSDLPVAGFSSPWHSFLWIKSPKRWLFWVEWCPSQSLWMWYRIFADAFKLRWRHASGPLANTRCPS